MDKKDALIVVVDTNDKERLGSFRDKFLLPMLSSDELRDFPVLVLANKQDLPGAMSVVELIEKLSLCDVKQNWTIQPCCVTDGNGIYEGLDWLTHQLER